MKEFLVSVLTRPEFLIAWGVLVAISLAIIVWDLWKKNPQIMSLMKWVWLLTVLYSGPLGLWIYYYSGRKQIPHDSLWRRGFRSVAHCYSGCGAGEVAGVVIAVGLLSLGNWWVAALTFTLAYVAGFAMTMGPLMQEGVPFKEALWDAIYSESVSIAIMEITAIGVDLWLASQAKLTDVLFWSSLVFSLSVGLIAAYPVNVLLVRWGVKEGMMNPKEAHTSH